jgi:hypothetical protein
VAITLNEIATGRKTFFIAPDTSLMPESFLEDFFALGYECYYIENDKKINLRKKLDVLISLFHDVIIFFNIDAEINGIDEWTVFIRNLIDSYNNQAEIGILYTKRQNKNDRIMLERKYLYEMGLSCGCIQLEHQKKNNFEIIEKILYMNQAQGRRKTIRAICPKSCTFSFTIDERNYSGNLQDISLSHFSFTCPEGYFNSQMYEKIEDIHFNIKGYIFRSSAILIMKRNLNFETLYIMAFLSSTGTNGLDERIRVQLIPNIYQLMSTNFKTMMNQVYAKMGLGVTNTSHIEIADSTEDDFS